MSASIFSTSATGPSAVAQRIEQLARHPWTPRIVNALVLVLFCASLAQWTWKWLYPGGKSPPAATQSMNPPSVKTVDINTIIRSNLFGKADEKSRSLEQIPISSLNIVVTGLMAAGAAGFALVSIGGAPELPVFIGDELMSGVVLEAVLVDRVLVRRGGMTESLLLKENAPGLPAGSLVTASAASPESGINAVAPNSYAVDREWLNEQMTTPELLKQARIVPNAGGGFLVRNIQPGSLYDKFGLKVGDVIRTVNGKQVNSVTDVMKIYGELTKSGAGGNITLSVVRAGRPEQLTYNLQ